MDVISNQLVALEDTNVSTQDHSLEQTTLNKNNTSGRLIKGALNPRQQASLQTVPPHKVSGTWLRSQWETERKQKMEGERCNFISVP